MANRVYGYQGYNKGYQFETSPKKIQPEYEPEEETKHKVSKTKKNNVNKKENVQTKKISKEQISRRIRLVCYIVFGFSVLFTISYRDSIINEKFSNKEQLKNKLAEIQKINEQLEVGIENELNLTSVEKLAKEKLGMSKLNNSQKIYISVPKTEHIESKSASLVVTKKENGFDKFFSDVKEFFNIK